MADKTKTYTLLTELEQIDVHEDEILGELLRRGAALEEHERRSRLVTVAELRALRAGLDSLETAIDTLQAGVARAESAATEPNAKPANGNGGTTGYGKDHEAPGTPVAPAAAPDPAPASAAKTAPPAPPPTFEELAACIREHDAEGGRLRELLRERFATLEQAAIPDAIAIPHPDPIAIPYDAQEGGGGTAPPGDAARTLRLRARSCAAMTSRPSRSRWRTASSAGRSACTSIATACSTRRRGRRHGASRAGSASRPRTSSTASRPPFAR